jgi:hypothetical protein
MSSFRVRPKFKIEIDKSVNELYGLINQSLQTTSLPIQGALSHTHGFIQVKESEKHYWSPQLSFSFEETNDLKTIVRGMYGPNQQVWLTFILGYSITGLGMFFLSIYGLSRYYLNLDSTILWIVPALFIIWVALWLMAQFGQKVGAEQTYLIHHFFEEAVHERIHISKIR